MADHSLRTQSMPVQARERQDGQSQRSYSEKRQQSTQPRLIERACHVLTSLDSYITMD